MGFKEAVRTCMREKYFTFQGRASRSEYWYFYLFFIVIIVVFAVFASVLINLLFNNSEPTGFGPLAFMVVGGFLFIYLIIPQITVYVRRFHDRNLSGWWILFIIVVGFVPYVGVVVSIVAFVITVLKGTDGDNKYGQDPLKVQNSADVFS